MPLDDEESRVFMAELARRNAELRTERLAAAKRDAAARGKEPFDLAKLETMCDTSSEGRVDPVESRRKRFEEWYYVWHPEVRTLKELARKIEEYNRWSGN